METLSEVRRDHDRRDAECGGMFEIRDGAAHAGQQRISAAVQPIRHRSGRVVQAPAHFRHADGLYHQRRPRTRPFAVWRGACPLFQQYPKGLRPLPAYVHHTGRKLIPCREMRLIVRRISPCIFGWLIFLRYYAIFCMDTIRQTGIGRLVYDDRRTGKVHFI